MKGTVLTACGFSCKRPLIGEAKCCTEACDYGLPYCTREGMVSYGVSYENFIKWREARTNVTPLVFFLSMQDTFR